MTISSQMLPDQNKNTWLIATAGESRTVKAAWAEGKVGHNCGGKGIGQVAVTIGIVGTSQWQCKNNTVRIAQDMPTDQACTGNCNRH